MSITYTYRTDLGLQQRQVGAQDIADAERTLGVTLPQDFKDFLRAHDGPSPTPAWFPATTPQGAVWHGPVLHFLSTAGPRVRRLGQRANCLETTTQASRDVERLPAHLVVIGQMFTQPRMLLISTAANDHGSVYAWNVGAKRFKPDQLVHVARSFIELLGLLREPPGAVAAVFRRLLADTLQETSVITDDVAFPHLKMEQALRNVRPYIDTPAIQTVVDAGLAQVTGMQDESGKSTRLSALIGEVQAALRADTGSASDHDTVAARSKQWEYDGPEARAWLRDNRNNSALAANHFPSTQAARKFVDELYVLGATRVIVPETSIQDEDDMGPYADALVVFPPADVQAREAIYRRCERELDEPTNLDVNDTSPLFLWWD
jgi:hypothetical protein